MMPPHCKLCRKRSRTHPDEKFKLVRFKLTPEQDEERKWMKENRRVGHPPGVHWFCSDHAARALEFKHLTWEEARKALERPPSLWARLRGFVLQTLK